MMTLERGLAPLFPRQGDQVPRVGNAIEIGEFVLDLDARTLLLGQEPISLGSRATGILLALARRPGQPVSKKTLLEEGWQADDGRQIFVEPGSLQVQIFNLRKVLGKTAIRTVMDRGYMLTLPVRNRSSMLARFAVPQLLEPLVGREEDARQLKEMIQRHRLVTLLGSGGVGKTSLAASVLSKGLQQPVEWLELATVSDEESLVRLIAAAAKIELGLQDGLDQLVGRISASAGLIVLDNAEHLIEAVAKVVFRLLERGPRLAILVTSQAPLNITGEVRFRLGELALPEETAQGDELLRAPSMQLFMQVLERQGHAPLGLAEVTQAARIVRALAGHPLAILQVASNVQALDLAGTGSATEGLFELKLDDPSRPLRQRSLQDAYLWSLDHLAPDSRKVFHAVSMFPGGVDARTLNMLAAGLGLTQAAVHAAIRELVDRSFLFRRSFSQRFMAPETLRHFSRQDLEASGEGGVMDALLIETESKIATAVWHDYRRLSFPRTLASYGEERENLRAGLEAAVRRNHATAAVRICLAAWAMWTPNGREYSFRVVREAVTEEVLEQASPKAAATYRLFTCLSFSMGGMREWLKQDAVLETLQGEDGLDLAMAWALDSYVYRELDPIYADACYESAQRILTGFELGPIVQVELLQIVAARALSAGNWKAAQSCYERGLKLLPECCPGTVGSCIAEYAHALASIRDEASLLSLWKLFLDNLHRYGAGQRQQTYGRFVQAFAINERMDLADDAVRGLFNLPGANPRWYMYGLDGLAQWAAARGDWQLAARCLVMADAEHERFGRRRDRLAAGMREALILRIPAHLLEIEMANAVPVTMLEIESSCRQLLERP